MKWETAKDENDDEDEADALIREMENALGGNAEKSKESTDKAKPQAAAPAADAPAPAAAPAATEPSTATGTLPTETTTTPNLTAALTKVFEKTPKPVQMPSGALPNVNTLTFWMSQLAANLSAASVYSEYEEYAWIQERTTKTKEELADPGPRFIKLDQLLQASASKNLPKRLGMGIHKLD